MLAGLIRCVALAAILPLVAHAVPVPPAAPGTFVALAGSTIAAEPGLDGTILADEPLFARVTPPSVAAVPPFFAFGLQTQVVASALDGGLIFRYRLFADRNITGGVANVTDLALFGMGSYDYDIEYVTDLDMTGDGSPDDDRGPTDVFRSLAETRLDYRYGFPLTNGNLFALPQASSYGISHRTNATGYSNNGSAAIL